MSLRNSSDSSRKQIFSDFVLFYHEIVCCVYSLEASSRLFEWAHPTYNFCVENRKIPKLSLFATWFGIRINPQWLELRMSRTMLYALKDIRANEVHYENTPIQIYRKFHLQKTENFQIKNLIFFSYFCSKHGLWVLVRTASRDPQSTFLSRNMKNKVYHCNGKFYYIKVGLMGSKLYRYVFVTRLYISPLADRDLYCLHPSLRHIFSYCESYYVVDTHWKGTAETKFFKK